MIEKAIIDVFQSTRVNVYLPYFMVGKASLAVQSLSVASAKPIIQLTFIGGRLHTPQLPTSKSEIDYFLCG